MTEDGVVPARNGPSRRSSGDTSGEKDKVTLHPADLSVALRAAVSGIGSAGPPPGGLAKVRRKAKVRQRNRAILAGTAGVLMIFLGVTVATGDRFSIVPTLTGGLGLGNGDSGGSQPGGQSGQGPSAAGESRHLVTPGAGATPSRRTGPAIGPGVTTLPAPPAGASQTPLCTAVMLSISTTLGATDGAIRYGEIDVIAQNACVVADPPVLEVTNAAGTAAASVQIMPVTAADQSAAPGLPLVPGTGTSAVLLAGQAYEFQFAWVAAACPQPSSSPSAAATATDGPGVTDYSLTYALPGATTVPGVDLDAACDVQVYVTDVYVHGTYPTPAPTPSAAPTAGSPTSGTPTSPSGPTDTGSPQATVAPTEAPSAPDSAGKGATVPVTPAVANANAKGR